MRCKGPDDTIRDISWKFLKDAWVPAITICTQKLYPIRRAACSAGESHCDDVCVNLNTDATNCGTCGNTCDEDEICVSGECVHTLPIISTDSLNIFGTSGQIEATITSQGASNITSYGIVWSDSDNPTIEDNIKITGTSSFTGGFSEESSYDLDHGVTYYFRAFATNSYGTAYGETFSDVAFICLIKGTQVMLSNGNQKPIENVTYHDDLLVWNFDDGKFDTAKPIWILKEFTMPNYRIMKFSDGSELGTIAGVEGHSIFNIQKGMFTHLNADETPINTVTFNNKKENISLVGSETIEEEIEFYNIITNYHINMFANGILTSSKLNNLYPIIDMKFAKYEKVLNTQSEFNIPDDLFTGMRLSEQPNSDQVKEKIKKLIESQLHTT